MRFRRNFLIGFVGLVAIMALVGILSITQTSELRRDIALLLSEDMGEALEETKSGASFILLGSNQYGNDLIARNESRFEKALHIESRNVTGPLEGEKVAELQQLYTQYKSTLNMIQDPAKTLDARREIYLAKLIPLYQQITETADEARQIYQDNTTAAYGRNPNQAVSKHRQTFVRFPRFGWPSQTGG